MTDKDVRDSPVCHYAEKASASQSWEADAFSVLQCAFFDVNGAAMAKITYLCR